jgi:REP element-mobilizing transposase RayT
MKETSHPHSSKLRLHRRVTPGAFLITKCLNPRLEVIDSAIAAEICSALCFYAREGQIHLAAFVVMLDHWHAVFATSDEKNISERMNIMDSWIGKQTVAALKAMRCGWQRGFHDTEIRSAKQFQFFCAYVEENPVRVGLVKSASDCAWSSANPQYQWHLLDLGRGDSSQIAVRRPAPTFSGRVWEPGKGRSPRGL